MIEALEQALGYTFRDKSLLRNALTHSSYANEMYHESLLHFRNRTCTTMHACWSRP